MRPHVEGAKDIERDLAIETKTLEANGCDNLAVLVESLCLKVGEKVRQQGAVRTRRTGAKVREKGLRPEIEPSWDCSNLEGNKQKENIL